MKRKEIPWLKLGFFLYALVMLWLLFGQRWVSVSYVHYGEQLLARLNLVPLKTHSSYLNLLLHSTSPSLIRHAFINLGGNVATFIPLGFFLPALYEKLRSFWRFFFTVLLLIVAIEILQLFTLLGSCDVDDLILNLPGAAIGFGLWKLTLGKKRN